MKRIILALLACSSLWATPAGVFEWLGGPTVSSFSVTDSFGNNLLDPALVPYILMADGDGITSNLGVNFELFRTNGFEVSAVYSIERQFVVTHPGGFFLSLLGTGTTSGLVCNPGNCGGMGFNLSASSMGLSITDDVSLPMPQTDLYHEITASGDNSDLFVLRRGIYTLDQEVNATAWAAEYPGMDLTATSDLVGMDPPDAVPEPKYAAAFVLLLCGMVWFLIRRDDRERTR